MITTVPQSPTLADLLSHLIRFPTITDAHATNRAALDWVEQQLTNLPLHILRLEHNDFPALIVTTRPTRTPRLWLQAHMDVVPAPVAAFEPRLAGGRLIGRGSYDMKFAIATFIALLQELGSKLSQYNLGLMITTDEEVGGQDGVHWLTQNGYRGEAVLLPDGGVNWEMETGAKGIVWWKLTSRGRASHASRPWNGVNAIDQLIRFVDELRRHTVIEPCGDPAHEHATLNLGRITGGTAANQVADTAEAYVDIRLTPGTTLDTVAAWVEAARQAIPGVDAETVVASAPYLVPDDGPGVMFRRIAERVTGHPLHNIIAHGASDARFFAAHNIPVITVRPTGGDHHGPAEWIDLADLDRFYQVIRDFTVEWAHD
ncbi:MAG TPA: M20/M25/M40 family metallo-hydrolase [Candidatus Saccharimonadia bacterium]|nr:M20/M25/M40 family metallo-hydrolase [Candidatus Saccharimonadia bacterium]